MSAPERNGSERETEVVAKPTRRRFTLEYKRRIVREADGCKTSGAVGALLRREGLYSSHLAVWRAARAGRVGRRPEKARAGGARGEGGRGAAALWGRRRR